MKHTAKLIVAALTLLALSAAQGCPASEEPDTSIQTATQPAPDAASQVEEMRLELGGDPAVTPNRVEPVMGLFPLPPGWTPPDEPPRPGYRLYNIEVKTVDAANLPTVRRFGINIVGFDNEGRVAMVSYPEDPSRPPQPFLLDTMDSTPHVYDLEIGPGVATFNIQAILVGQVGEGLIVTIEEYGTGPTGLVGGGRIEPVYEGQQRGAVVLQIPVAVPPTPGS